MNLIESWLKKTIIGLNLCPFAEEAFLNKHIFISKSNSMTEEMCYQDSLSALANFQSDSTFKTMLLYFPDWKISFLDFLDFSSAIDEVLIKLQLEDEFQVVVFHPEFCFNGLITDDPSNLVNRSPYPLLHFLRKVDLDLLNLTQDQAQEISLNNEVKLKKLTILELASHFPWIYSNKNGK